MQKDAFTLGGCEGAAYTCPPTDKYRQRKLGFLLGSPLWEGLRRALLQPVAELSMAGGAGGVSGSRSERDPRGTEPDGRVSRIPL